jgi:hypothetical protein
MSTGLSSWVTMTSFSGRQADQSAVASPLPESGREAGPWLSTRVLCIGQIANPGSLTTSLLSLVGHAPGRLPEEFEI